MDNESRISEYFERHNYVPYLQKHHKTYLAFAWAGYQRKGRGFVFLDHNKAVMDTNDNIMALPVEYLTADELIAKKGDDYPWIVHSGIANNVLRVVNKYDPEAEMATFEIFPLEDQSSVERIGINGTFPMRQIYEDRRTCQSGAGKSKK